MKALIYLLFSGIVLADLPRLTIEHGEKRQDLRVDEVDVTVRVEGDFVETRMSLNFFNETSMNQEGEFRLPLPEGASVNHYALEVNGKMREATVVEKQQALRAYETIKARNIDPGLVEKMENNIYRTRIFPVLPKQGKRVSIGYIQQFVRKGDAWNYQLPFGVTENIGKFHLRIEGDIEGVERQMTDGMTLQKDDDGYFHSSANSPVKGELILSRKIESVGFHGEIREVNAEGFVYVTGSIPQELTDQKAPKPEKLTVIWDASASGYVRDRKSELEFLGKLLGEFGEVSVELVAVHHEVENLGQFQIKAGEWKKLRETIEGVFHDGAADWRRLDFNALQGERIILFGGGESSFVISQVKMARNFQLVRSGALQSERVLADMANSSGGGVLDLSKMKLDEAVRRALETKLHVTGIDGVSDGSFAEIVDGHIRFFARSDRLDQERLTLRLKSGSGIERHITVELKKSGSGNALRYLWAQRRLEEMNRKSSMSSGSEKAGIIAHCQKYGLVSDFTSLIVLERMQDHIEFRIPPPEPELMDEYQRGIASDEKYRSQREQVAAVKYLWNRRSHWYQTKFPWLDAALLPRYSRVKKWTDAQISVFEKQQLEQTNLAEFLAWKKEAEEVMRGMQEVKNKLEVTEYTTKIKSLLEAGNRLGEKDAELPDKGEFAISVRGLVQEPQTLNLKAGRTLREAIKNAGGVVATGTEGRVALYRSGKRSVYNLLSKDYKDIKLLPGDMVVVMPPYRNVSMDDPFFAAPSGRGNQQQYENEAVLVEGDLPLSHGSELHDSGGDPWAAGGAGSALSPSAGLPSSDPETRWNDVPIMAGEVAQANHIEDEVRDRIDELLKSGNFWEMYQKQRSQVIDDIPYFTEVAKELYKRGEISKARRVLSNSYSRTGFHVPSLRRAAYWMIEYKDYGGAAEIFEAIAIIFPEDALLVLDLMRLVRVAEGTISESRFTKLLGDETVRALLERDHAVSAEMVMMERNRFKPRHFDAVTSRLLSDNEVYFSDIRIVAYCSDSSHFNLMQILDPTGARIASGDISITGGRCVSGKGVSEFMIRRALPGEYRIQLGNMDSRTYQVEIFLNWGRPDETRKMFTLSANGKKEPIDAGVVSFDFEE